MQLSVNVNLNRTFLSFLKTGVLSFLLSMSDSSAYNSYHDWTTSNLLHITSIGTISSSELMLSRVVIYANLKP